MVLPGTAEDRREADNLRDNPGRAATARRHFQSAGVYGLVTIVEGDAHQNISRLKEPIDVLFIDADKEGYADYLTRLP